MVPRRLYTTSMVMIPLLLTATSLCGQQAAADSSATSNNSLTGLQQELDRSRVELESKKRENLKLAKKRRELEAEVARLREQILEQEKSVEAVLQGNESMVDQEQPAVE